MLRETEEGRAHCCSCGSKESSVSVLSGGDRMEFSYDLGSITCRDCE